MGLERDPEGCDPTGRPGTVAGSPAPGHRGRRVDIFEMLLDAGTAYELTGVAPEQVIVDLLARFDVYQGGPLFQEPVPDD